MMSREALTPRDKILTLSLRARETVLLLVSPMLTTFSKTWNKEER